MLPFFVPLNFPIFRVKKRCLRGLTGVEVRRMAGDVAAEVEIRGLAGDNAWSEGWQVI